MKLLIDNNYEETSSFLQLSPEYYTEEINVAFIKNKIRPLEKDLRIISMFLT